MLSQLHGSAREDHVPGGNHGAGGDQQAGDQHDVAVGGVAGEDQDRGREQRGRIGGGAEHLDVALLDADVPDVEGQADRAEAQRHDRRPLPELSGQTVCSSSRWQMLGEQRGGEAEAGDGVARHAGEAARQHRIARPDEAPRPARRRSPARTRPSSVKPWPPVTTRTAPASASSAPGDVVPASAVRPAAGPRTARSAAARE